MDLIQQILHLGPGRDGVAIVPADTNLTRNVRAIWVGTTGDVVLITPEGTTLTFVGVPAGSLLPIWARQVKAATTAGSIVGIY